ncbi:MAG: phage major capsid protein [Candidatus Omnitrophota bacterium]
MELSVLSEAFKHQILPVVNDFIVKQTPGWDDLAKDGETTGGEYVKIPIITEESYGTGSVDEKDPHPEAGTMKIENVLIRPRTTMGSLSISGTSLRATKGGQNSVIDALVAETQSSTKTFQDNIERQLFMGNGTGKLAEVVSSSTVEGVTRVVLTDVPGAIYLTKGTLVQFCTADASKTAVLGLPAYKIGKVFRSSSPGGNYIDLVGTATGVTAGRGIYLNRSKDKEFMGYFGIVGDAETVPGGMFQEKQRAGSEMFSARVVTDNVIVGSELTTGLFTPTDLDDIILDMELDRKEKPTVFWMPKKFKTAYRDFYGTKVQFVNVGKVDGHIETDKHDNVPLRIGKYVYPGTILVIQQETMKFHPMAKGSQLIQSVGEGIDDIVLRKQAGKDIWDAQIQLVGQVACHAPYRNVVYRNNNSLYR